MALASYNPDFIGLVSFGHHIREDEIQTCLTFFREEHRVIDKTSPDFVILYEQQGGLSSWLQANVEKTPQEIKLIQGYPDIGKGLRITYDIHEKMLFLQRDDMGLYPLHYMIQDERLYFATRINYLLKLQTQPKPNRTVLAYYIFDSLDYPIGNQTLYQNIYSITAGTCMSFKEGRFLSSKVSSSTSQSSFDYTSAEACWKTFRQVFGSAITSYQNSNSDLSLSLSGGLDSSTIFALGQEQGLEIKALNCFHENFPEADERDYLKLLKQQNYISHFAYPQSLCLEDFQTCISMSESPLLDEQFQSLITGYQLTQAMGSDVHLTGHWGDQVFNCPEIFHKMFSSFQWIQLLNFIRQARYWHVDVNTMTYYKHTLLDMISYWPESVKAPLKWLRDRSFPSHQSSFIHPDFNNFYDQCSYHEADIHLPGMLQSPMYMLCLEWHHKLASPYGIRMGFPFMEPDFLRYLEKMPLTYMMHQGAPKAPIRFGLKGILPDEILQRKDKGDFTQVVEAMLKPLLPEIIEILKNQPLLCQYEVFEAKRFEQHLKLIEQEIKQGKHKQFRELIRFLGLELWLRSFF